MQTQSLVHVLVAEDSITTRRYLVELINNMPGLMVCGQANNGLEAVRLTKELHPDVISMDIRMPRMDGLEATKQIMASTPTPIVAVSSSVAQREVDTAMQAIEAGALIALEKPSAAPYDTAKQREYLRMLHLMASVSVVRRQQGPIEIPPVPDKFVAEEIIDVVVIGASAGGPAAIVQILNRLPADFPLPILVVQHLGVDFVPGFANWLSSRCRLKVQVALEGRVPTPGEVWVAPGGKHMTLNNDGQIVLHSDKGAHRHQPSIDVLFESVAQLYGPRAIGVLLTGMGNDGARGMTMLRAQGARTIAQDEETCVVFGMPAAAIQQQAVEYVLPLQQIADVLLDLVRVF